MTQDKWTAIDRYLNEHLVPADSALESALVESKNGGLPDIGVATNQGKFLQLLARIQGAKNILEIGTLGGYSTIWLARALPPDGKLVTLEYSEKHAEVARKNIARAGLAHAVEVRVGKALDSLPKLEAEHKGPFDLVFIDADKENIPHYFAWALKLARVGTLIIVDNVVRQGKVLEADTSDVNVQGVRRFFELVAKEPRVTATAIQTVGSKGHDGFAAVLVTG